MERNETEERKAYRLKCKHCAEQQFCKRFYTWTNVPCDGNCNRMIKYDKKIQQEELSKTANLPVGTVVWIAEYGDIPKETEIRGYARPRSDGKPRYMVKGHNEYTYTEDEMFATRKEVVIHIAKKKVEDFVKEMSRFENDFQKMGITTQNFLQLIQGAPEDK